MDDAELRYYGRLNKAFEKYDAIVYAARQDHDTEISAARQQLFDEAAARFNVLRNGLPGHVIEGTLYTAVEKAVSEVKDAADTQAPAEDANTTERGQIQG